MYVNTCYIYLAHDLAKVLQLQRKLRRPIPLFERALVERQRWHERW